MRPFSGGKSGQQAFWVKLPFLCLIAATLAFAMVVLIAPLVSSREAKISADDPSRQALVIPPETEESEVRELPAVVLPPKSEASEPVVREVVAPNIEQAVVVPPKSKEVVAATPKLEEEVAAPPKLEESEQATTGTNASLVLLQRPSQQDMEECDLFQGKWEEIASPKAPLYENASCPIMSQQQNCPGNGRPDAGFLNWKWKPNNCTLPDFDARGFLELMRGKTLAFIGDSVTRNQYEALLCALWQVATPVAHGNKKILRWEFRDYDFKAVRIWSSWLVNVSTDAIGFAPKDLNKLHLDALDANIAEYLPSFDVLVVASGHWWGNKPGAYVVNGTSVVGGQQWWNEKFQKQHDTLSAYAIAMKTALQAILAHPGYKGLTILRTYSPDHYEGGAWNTGGSCTGKTKPLTDAELPQNAYIDAVYGHQMAAVTEALRTNGADAGARLRVMDITRPFLYRADGHPGPYRDHDPNKRVTRGKDGKPPPQDCLHWCMPGAIDTWNEYLFAMLQRHYKQ